MSPWPRRSTGSPDDRATLSGAPAPSAPERSAAIRRATALLCLRLNWAPLHEVTLPNFRRADLLALRPDGGLVCIEVKSGARDFLADQKWPEYRDFADALYFAVDPDFPLDLLPSETGLILAHGTEAEIARPAPSHPLSPGRRRSLTQRFAMLAATRLAARDDPAGVAALRTALLVE
jgi:hypothetical protein